MLFYSHKLDGSTGGKNWECDLASITSRYGPSWCGDPFIEQRHWGD
ncbi:MAG: hypothetical protein RLZZ362_790 [Actinomycetota bacterium]